MNNAWAAFRGTVGRFVLRVLARVAEDAWIKCESRLMMAEYRRHVAFERVVECKRRAKEARRIHDAWQARLAQNVAVSGPAVAGTLDRPCSAPVSPPEKS